MHLGSFHPSVLFIYVLIWFDLQTTTTLTTNDIVINKLTQILSYLRQGKRELKKLKKKEKGKKNKQHLQTSAFSFSYISTLQHFHSAAFSNCSVYLKTLKEKWKVCIVVLRCVVLLNSVTLANGLFKDSRKTKSTCLLKLRTEVEPFWHLPFSEYQQGNAIK